ncbi:MAG: hypothetical protein ACAH95_09640 [Fimbriimonas sp.]
MLPIICVLATNASQIQFEIPVRNVRPSRIVAMIRGTEEKPSLISASARIEADDAKWTIRISGNADDLMETRKFIKLADVERKSVRVRVQIDSPADRLNLETSTTIPSGNKWRMSEDAINSTIALTPRLNSDGTCTFFLLARFDGGEVDTNFRLRRGELHKIPLGGKRAYEVRQQGEEVALRDRSIAGPTLTISYEDLKQSAYRAPKT